MNKNYDFKLLALCNAKEKMIEKDFRKCVEASRRHADIISNCKTVMDFATSNEISENSLYQRIIEEIGRNQRKGKFKIKIDFKDLLFLREYPMIMCLCSDGVNVIQARIEKKCSMMNNLRLVVYITCKRSIEEHLNYVKYAKKPY